MFVWRTGRRLILAADWIRDRTAGWRDGWSGRDLSSGKEEGRWREKGKWWEGWRELERRKGKNIYILRLKLSIAGMVGDAWTDREGTRERGMRERGRERERERER